MKINPRQMEKMMKQMGMQTSEIDAEEVIIKKSDGSQIVVTSPEVSKVNVMGRESFQISGHIEERSAEDEGFSDDDVAMVAEQTGVSKEDALKALEEFGDIAEAIMHLKKE